MTFFNFAKNVQYPAYVKYWGMQKPHILSDILFSNIKCSQKKVWFSSISEELNQGKESDTQLETYLSTQVWPKCKFWLFIRQWNFWPTPSCVRLSYFSLFSQAKRSSLILPLTAEMLHQCWCQYRDTETPINDIFKACTHVDWSSAQLPRQTTPPSQLLVAIR